MFFEEGLSIPHPSSDRLAPFRKNHPKTPNLQCFFPEKDTFSIFSAPLVFAFGQPRFSLSGKGRHPELIKAIEPTLGDRSIYREPRAFFNLKILSSPIQISAAWGYSLKVVNLDSGVFLDSAQERI